MAKVTIEIAGVGFLAATQLMDTIGRALLSPENCKEGNVPVSYKEGTLLIEVEEVEERRIAALFGIEGSIRKETNKKDNAQKKQPKGVQRGSGARGGRRSNQIPPQAQDAQNAK